MVEEFAATSILKSRELEQELHNSKVVTSESKPIIGELPSIQTIRTDAPPVHPTRLNFEEEFPPSTKVGKLFQSTFKPSVKAQKKKTWKRRTSSLYGRGASSLIANLVSTHSTKGKWPPSGVKRKNDDVGTVEERRVKQNIPPVNVRGLGNPSTVNGLRTIVHKHSPSLVFLFDTKLCGNWVEGIRRHNFHVDCVGSGGGILLMWNDDWDVTVKSYSIGYMMLLYNVQGLCAEEEIVGEVEWYFIDISQTANPINEKIQHGTEVINSRISVVDDERLMAPFTQEDIFQAVMVINAIKAPGPGVYHALFFSDILDIVGERASQGLTSVATHGKYLGLPTVIGRNKKWAFEGICEKVRKPVRRWKRSFFLAGGREGMELLKYSLQRSIGDGTQVQAYKDSWLPRLISLQPITRRINDDCLVSKFILPSSAWDVVKLQQIFLPMDVDIILSILLARQATKDGWCLNYDQDGVYNVKSGYLLAWSLQVEEGVVDLSKLIRCSNTTYLPKSSVGGAVGAPSMCTWTMQETFLFLFDTLSHEAFELMMTILWWLEFKEYGRQGFHLGLGLANPVVPTRWIPPPPNSFALATDALVVPGRGFVGLGGVIRDVAKCGLVGVVIWCVYLHY
uniref:Uncharacterized protein n=1 Tax=Cannabis sativa TaxID=3483 RepID=A0A803PV57_CANSA